MLTGVRGIGKTTTARLIARALNYPGAPSIDMPALTPQCEAILESRHIDVIEMDAASNTGVDNMREIIDSVRYAPVSRATRSTSSTKSTCCRRAPSTRCSKRWKSRRRM